MASSDSDEPSGSPDHHKRHEEKSTDAVKALESGDSERAASAMDEHLDHVLRYSRAVSAEATI